MRKLLLGSLISGFCALSASAEYDSVLSGLDVLSADRYARIPMGGGGETIIFDGVGYPLKTHIIREPQANGKTLSTTIGFIKELTDQLFISKAPVLLDEQVPDEDGGKKTLDEILAREVARIAKQAEGQSVVFSGFVAKAADQATNGDLERALQKAAGQVHNGELERAVGKAVGQVFRKKKCK